MPAIEKMKSKIVFIPLTLSEANEFVAAHHRHHKPVLGHRFSIGAIRENKLVGVAICGRPVARMIDWRSTLEINRLCTDGTKNVCSALLARCAAIAKLMGFLLIETTILAGEPGTSLIAADFRFRRNIQGRDWNCPSRPGRRTDQPMCNKHVYGKELH